MRILNMKDLVSHGNTAGRKIVGEILEAGMEAGDPYNAAIKLMQRKGNILTLNGPEYEPMGAPKSGPIEYNLDKDVDRIFLFGAGKGVLRIAKALEDVLGDYLTGGCVIVKKGDKEDLSGKIEVFYGAHPVPDEDCARGCRRIIEMSKEKKLTQRDLVFTVIGNGVGSLLTLPAEGVSLDAVSQMVRILQIEKGVGTAELSIIRNQVDQLKGGRLTRLLKPAKMIHLLALDCNYGNTGIPGYMGLMRANVWIHSMPDVGSREGAIALLKKWEAYEQVDESIRTYLQQEHPENEVMRFPEFEAMDCRIFGLMPDTHGPLVAAMKKADELGYPAHLINRVMEVEASVMGRFFGYLARCVISDKQPFPAPCALFFTGEMLVTVGDGDGIGGRNQESALSSARLIQNQKRIVIGCVDTDGTDGPGGHFDDEAAAKGITTLSGGIVDGYTFAEAFEKGIDIGAALKNHGTSQPLWKLNCGVWATQNISVQDLIVVLVMSENEVA
jgi:glycerate-2-kinase